jgi:hypothetical protein
MQEMNSISCCNSRRVLAVALTLLVCAILANTSMGQLNIVQPPSSLGKTVQGRSGSVVYFYVQNPDDNQSIVSIVYSGKSNDWTHDLSSVLDLRSYPNLCHLTFYQTHVTQEMLECIRDLKTISKLEIEACSFERGAAEAIGSLSALDALLIDGNCPALRELGFLPRLTSLEQLELIGQGFPEHSITKVFQCKKLKTLSLTVSSDATEDCFVGLSALNELRSLSINGWPASAAAIKELGTMQKLEKLRLAGASLNGDDLSLITTLKNLEELSLATISSNLVSSQVNRENRIRRLQLQFDMPDLSPHMFGFLSNFLKLEKFVCNNRSDFPADLMVSHPSLKEVVLLNANRPRE